LKCLKLFFLFVVHVCLSETRSRSKKVPDRPGLQIKSLEEVRGVCLLPCLEELVLHHNPLATIVDYRLKVLEAIGSRYL
jgi:hypothetical protein